MKHFSAMMLIAALMVTVAAFAQPPMPTPAPELKKYDYFAGTWKMEGDMKPGPMGPGGKFTGTEKNEWMDGAFFLLTHSVFSGAGMGEGKGLAVMGYDSEKKAYTYHAFNSMGQHEEAVGTLEGDTWTWNSEPKFGGQAMKSRFVIKQLSPTSYTFKWDMGPAGGELATMMEGKATKQ